MKITFKDGKAGKVHISVDGEYRLTVDGNYWYALGIASGSEIDGEQFERLAIEINRRRAFNAGADLLSRREHSRFELIRKLNERGYADCAQSAADELEECGYLSDERFAAALTTEYSEKKGMGKRRIAMELYRRGVDKDIAQEAIDTLDDNEAERITALLDGKFSRYTDDEKGRSRCYNALVRLGYSPSEIRRAMRSRDRRSDE